MAKFGWVFNSVPGRVRSGSDDMSKVIDPGLVEVKDAFVAQVGAAVRIIHPFLEVDVSKFEDLSTGLVAEGKVSLEWWDAPEFELSVDFSKINWLDDLKARLAPVFKRLAGSIECLEYFVGIMPGLVESADESVYCGRRQYYNGPSWSLCGDDVEWSVTDEKGTTVAVRINVRKKSGSWFVGDYDTWYDWVDVRFRNLDGLKRMVDVVTEKYAEFGKDRVAEIKDLARAVVKAKKLRLDRVDSRELVNKLSELLGREVDDGE